MASPVGEVVDLLVVRGAAAAVSPVGEVVDLLVGRGAEAAVSPVGEVVDLLVAAVDLRLEVDQLPEVVVLDVSTGGGPHLHLCDRNQHLVPDDLHLGRVTLPGGTLSTRGNTSSVPVQQLRQPVLTEPPSLDTTKRNQPHKPAIVDNERQSKWSNRNQVFFGNVSNKPAASREDNGIPEGKGENSSVYQYKRAI